MWVKSFPEKDWIQWEPSTSHINSLFVWLGEKRTWYLVTVCLNLLFSSLLSKTIWPVNTSHYFSRWNRNKFPRFARTALLGKNPFLWYCSCLRRVVAWTWFSQKLVELIIILNKLFYWKQPTNQPSNQPNNNPPDLSCILSLMLYYKSQTLCAGNTFQNLIRKYSLSNPALFLNLASIINDNSQGKAELSAPVSWWSDWHSVPSSHDCFVQVPAHLVSSCNTLDISSDSRAETPGKIGVTQSTVMGETAKFDILAEL